MEEAEEHIRKLHMQMVAVPWAQAHRVTCITVIKRGAVPVYFIRGGLWLYICVFDLPMGDKVVKPWDVYRAHINQVLAALIVAIRKVDSKVSAAVLWVLQVPQNTLENAHVLALCTCCRECYTRGALSAQEFEPWVKWVIMDAVLALAVGIISPRVPRLQSAFRAIGWL